MCLQNQVSGILLMSTSNEELTSTKDVGESQVFGFSSYYDPDNSSMTCEGQLQVFNFESHKVAYEQVYKSDQTKKVFTVILENGEDGWIIAKCKELSGAISQGKNRKEAIENIDEAISLMLEEINNGEKESFTVKVE